ncbi:phage tail protein [Shewanella sp. KX20019]|uniref:phage tail protein n=1 Tax=Shewanella sp. KX20019 TaxID=2803864 RepID=UPI001925F8C6|nr:phage tail protein [Shewanella sp. KX20019]QQX80845.1 phage tail protein [Shewanella sp. KX20019]
MSITIRPKTNPDVFINRLSGRLDGMVARSNVRALNKGIDAAATVATKLIAKETSLKQKAVRTRLKKIKASKAQQIARLDARKARPPNLIRAVSPSQQKPGYFNEITRQASTTKSGKHRPAKHRAKGVKAKTYGARRTHDSTFIAKATNQTILVFSRKSDNAYPIKPIYGPSIKREFTDKEISTAFSKRAEEMYSKEFDRLIQYEIKKAGFV